MKIYFEHNQKKYFNKSYSVFEKKLEQLLKNINTNKKEIEKIQNVIFKGIKLEGDINELEEIKVFYQEISNSVFVTWIFFRTETSKATEEYIQYANDMLRDLGIDGIMKHREIEKKIFEEYKEGQSKEVLDAFPTSPFYLVSEFESPIYITKGNTKIDYTQNYFIKK